MTDFEGLLLTFSAIGATMIISAFAAGLYRTHHPVARPRMTDAERRVRFPAVDERMRGARRYKA